MKYKKVIDIFKKSKSIILLNSDNTQWVMDGKAIYPLHGVPKLDIDTLCAVFDISEKERKKIYFDIKKELPSNLCFEDACDTENELKNNGMYIAYKGDMVLPLETQQGLKLLDTKYLNPIHEDELALYERIDTKGNLYIVAKVGFMLKAIIIAKPCDNEEFVKNVEIIAKESRYALNELKGKEIK